MNINLILDCINEKALALTQAVYSRLISTDEYGKRMIELNRLYEDVEGLLK